MPKIGARIKRDTTTGFFCSFPTFTATFGRIVGGTLGTLHPIRDTGSITCRRTGFAYRDALV
jgi:hypothetical protein